MKTPYTKEVDEYFKEYINHDLIKYMNKHVVSGFSYDLPLAVALNLNSDFTLREESIILDIQNKTKNFSIEEYLVLLKKFS